MALVPNLLTHFQTHVVQVPSWLKFFTSRYTWNSSAHAPPRGTMLWETSMLLLNKGFEGEESFTLVILSRLVHFFGTNIHFTHAWTTFPAGPSTDEN